MTPNTDQVLSLVRAVLTIAGTILTTKGMVSTVDWTTYSGAVLMVVPIVWSMFAHTDSAKLASVEALPDVKNIVVRVTAPESMVADAAADVNRPKIVAA